MKEHAGRQAREVEGYVVDLGDKVGLLRLIAERPMCASCHGSAPMMNAEVQAALKDRYPLDRAIDFGVGEIRGWFWVEVPKTSR